ncbi:MAG: ABC transporter permease [Gemmatimonadota bacterium]
MIRALIARIRSLWRSLRGHSDLQAEMAEEFRLHVDLRADDLVRDGMSPAEARRQARLEFGSVERYRDEGRASRGLRPFDELRFSWLDVKLSLRMLVRYPGLTVVAGLAIAFGIWAGAGTFEMVTQLLRPTLPLDEGHRIVGIQLRNLETGGVERRALHEFVIWRGELTSVTDLGAFRTLERNLILGDGTGEPTMVAEMSASGFQVARVPPLLGRVLIEADERPDALPVVVIGYDIWQSRFGGDTQVVGRTVHLGSTRHTIVGVMPQGFAFPVSHRVWTPLRAGDPRYGPREGPSVQLFGRLTRGATVEQAQAELTTLGRSTTAESPDTHEFIRPWVMPFAAAMLNIPLGTMRTMTLGVLSTNLVPILLLLLICGNVALLIFARTAAREGELVVRSALGASRRRIVVQLFAEALALGAVGTMVGLAGASFGMRWAFGVVEALQGADLPFWFEPRLSTSTVLYAGVLTVLGAAIAGIVPAIKLTRGVGARLKAATAGGGGPRLGGIWSVVIVSQVAITVLFPAIAFIVREDGNRIPSLDLGFPAQEYVVVRLEMDREPPSTAPGDTSYAAFLARYGAAHQELERRLTDDPAVTGVTFAGRLPRMYHQWNQIEVDEGAIEPPDERGHRVSSAPIDVDYFEVLGTPVAAGRPFTVSDVTSGAQVVIVNTDFVEYVLGGRNPIGRRIRYIATETARTPTSEGPWYEIVGVAPDLGMTSGYGRSGIYHPSAPGDVYPVHMALRVRGDPGSFAPRVREAAMLVDPALRLHDLMPMNEITRADAEFYAFWFWLAVVVSSIALLLSLAGIYAVMSFAVSRRTREIGIRLALGAGSRRVVTAILARPLRQVGLGVLLGGALAGVLIMSIDLYQAGWAARAALFLGYAALMTGVCLLACIVPIRRALGVEPTEALRADA